MGNLLSTKAGGMGLMLLVVVGGFGSCDGWRAWKADQSANWPATEATVLRSEAERGFGKNAGYYAHVRYQYEVGGKAYLGNRERFQPAKLSASAHDSERAVASMYTVGRTILVRYNPESPSESVVIARPARWEGVWLSVGGVGGLGVMCLGIGWWQAASSGGDRLGRRRRDA